MRIMCSYHGIDEHMRISYLFLKSLLKELLKPPFSCFLPRSLRGVWLISSAPPLHRGSSPHAWAAGSWGSGVRLSGGLGRGDV